MQAKVDDGHFEFIGEGQWKGVRKVDSKYNNEKK